MLQLELDASLEIAAALGKGEGLHSRIPLWTRIRIAKIEEGLS